ncbi:MAG: peptidoglycan editing factor PgeF [Patescibacteria group bacterium]
MLEIITSEKFSKISEIRLAVSTKDFGNQSLQHPIVSKNETFLNRKRFFDSLNINSKNVVNAGLVHGREILWTTNANKNIDNTESNSLIQNFDGLATVERGLFLMVTIADCFPVFIFDPTSKCIALLHAGWRGVINNIVTNAIDTMKNKAQSETEKMVVYIGPGIHQCHFNVSKDLADQFLNSLGPDVLQSKNGNNAVNLPLTIKKQLIQAGINENNIEISPYCTYCDDRFFSSYRRDKEKYIAQAAIIGMI